MRDTFTEREKLVTNYSAALVGYERMKNDAKDRGLESDPVIVKSLENLKDRIEEYKGKLIKG